MGFLSLSISLTALYQGHNAIIDAYGVGRSPAGGEVPARCSGIIEVIATSDAVERMPGRFLLGQRVEDPGSTSDHRPGLRHEPLVDQSVGASPDGSGCACAAVPGPPAVHIERNGPGIGGNIRNLTVAVGVLVPYARPGLPARQRESLAQTTTGTPEMFAVGGLLRVALPDQVWQGNPKKPTD